MTFRLDSDRWREIERVFNDAIDRPAAERDACLLRACGNDVALRREIESLLQVETGATGFLERSALEESASAMAFDRGPLDAGSELGGYVIKSLLGAGGMGEVYHAHDRRLDRDVALKVLERSTALNPDYVRRFEEEARAASGLSHPNIVTVYAVGDDANVAYIAMELVRGRTLREILNAGAVAVDVALDLAVQLADALAAAHHAGIVHRDLKPENVMVTAEGFLKVLDFGIAKRRSPHSNGDADDGVIVGTAGYMSPEQSAGRPADHCSDQFSFGAILFELLTADPLGDRSLDEHLIPLEFRQVMRRCLQPEPADRYENSDDLAAELRQLRRARQREGDRQGVTRRRLLWLGGAAAVGAFGALSWRHVFAGPSARSLAVLPFTNVELNPAIDYLCDGLTEALIRRLGFVPGLEVAARSAVFNFKKSSISPVDAARQLHAEAALTGTVRIRDGRVAVSASMIRVRDGQATWSETYDRPVTDVLALQHDLARAIIDDAVRYPLAASDRRRFEQEATNNNEAHDFFLRGTYAMRKGGVSNYRNAREYLQKAVASDPAFALAYVPLSSTYTVMAVEGVERPVEAWPRANRNTRRALEIDPDLPEAYAERASFRFFFDRDWIGAESDWNRAIRAGMGPAMPELQSATAVKLFALGRLAEATAFVERARAMDALTPRFAVQHADLLFHQGRADEAARLYEEVLARAPEHADAWFGLAQLRQDQGRPRDAIEARRRAYDLVDAPAELKDALKGAVNATDLVRIERIAAECEIQACAYRARRGDYVSPLDVARAYAQIGDRDRAFDYLDAAFEDASPGLVFLNVDRAWAAARDDARFAAALAAMEFPKPGRSS